MPRNKLTRDFAWILIAYAAALLAAGLTVFALPHTRPLWQAAYADVAATLVIFAFSRAFANSSFYDAYWSVAPPVLLLFWWWIADMSIDLRMALLCILTLYWAVRLTHNWARGWQGLTHEDWRYGDLKEKTGPAYPLVDLLGIQLLPTVLVFLGCLPVWLASQAQAPLVIWDVLWIVLGFAAVTIELVADNQLRQHRLDPANRSRVLDTGVWALSRHPNYVGELGFWLALAIAGYVATGQWLAFVGFVAMLVLFLGISVPMIEKRQAHKPGYARYQARVGRLLPRLRRPA